MLLKLSDATKVERDGFTAWVYNLKKDSPAVSTVYVDCHAAHERVSVKASHRLYFVIEGEGKFTVGDEEHVVESKDVIIIEPKTPYSYEGQMTLFEVNFPATDSSDEVKN